MRTISLADRLEIPCSGTFTSSNLCLNDVDNDGNNELVVGHWESGPIGGSTPPEETFGHVQVFKGNRSTPWRKAEHLQMVSCVTVGDVCNMNKNYIVVVCSDSYCYFFDANEIHASTTEEDCGVMLVKHQQNLPASAKQVLIDDIDNDGRMEVVIAFSDRFVRSYRWNGTVGSDKSQLVLLQKWELAGHIGNMSVHRSGNNEVDLMVSQPGGSYVSLIVDSSSASSSSPAGAEGVPPSSLVYHPLFISSARNGMTKTEVLGSVHRERAKQASYSALCTIDGTLMLLDQREIIWSLQVDHQLIGLNKLDITNDEAEEVIVCSWDGMTYIVNHHKEIVRFQPDTACQAFVAGYYAVQPGRNEPVLVYATFEDCLVVYHNINLERIPGHNALHRLPEELKTKMQNKGLDVSTEAAVRNSISWLLYERPRWLQLKQRVEERQAREEAMRKKEEEDKKRAEELERRKKEEEERKKEEEKRRAEEEERKKIEEEEKRNKKEHEKSDEDEETKSEKEEKKTEQEGEKEEEVGDEREEKEEETREEREDKEGEEKEGREVELTGGEQVGQQEEGAERKKDDDLASGDRRTDEEDDDDKGIVFSLNPKEEGFREAHAKEEEEDKEKASEGELCEKAGLKAPFERTESRDDTLTPAESDKSEEGEEEEEETETKEEEKESEPKKEDVTLKEALDPSV